MKEASLRKKNIFNFSLTSLLLLAFSGITYYNLTENGKLQSKLDKIRTETAQIKNQTTDLQSKTIEIKKYKEMWTTLPESRKSTAILKADDINSKINNIAEKYSIIEPAIKITLPEQLNDGLFNRATINVVLTRISISFGAIDDSRALMFITEIANSLPGYPMITSFEIKKEKKYSNQDLIAISVGKPKGFVQGRSDILWYSYKNKEIEKKPEEKIEVTK